MHAIWLWLGLIITGNSLRRICNSFAEKQENIYTLRLVGPYCLKCIKLFKNENYIGSRVLPRHGYD